MAAALNVKPQPHAINIGSFSLPQSGLPSIHSALLSSIADLRRHYEQCNSQTTQLTPMKSSEMSCIQHISSSRSDVSPSSCGRENVIELVKDEAYWERRKKNNDAAKRSRDSRRQKEDELAARAASLEIENQRLREELDQLRTETEQLRMLLITSAPLLSSFPLTVSTTPHPSVITPNSNCRSAYPDSTQRPSVLISTCGNPP